MSTEKSKISKEIKMYIDYDDKIKNMEKNLRNLKKERQNYSDKIVEYLLDKNKSIKYGENIFKYKETKSQTGLSQNFLRKSVKMYFYENYKKMSDLEIDNLVNDLSDYIEVEK